MANIKRFAVRSLGEDFDFHLYQRTNSGKKGIIAIALGRTFIRSPALIPKSATFTNEFPSKVLSRKAIVKAKRNRERDVFNGTIL